jgi:UDP-2,3-diacylglucosamine pyrophosphatase LpxH
MICGMTTESWLVIPDLQVPLHDAEFVQKLIEVAESVRPHGLLFIGDLTDSTEVGRWVKGKSGEFTGDLQDAFDKTEKIVGSFRRAVGEGCKMVLIDSNHDSRTKEYISSNAPALQGLRSLSLPTLIGLERHHVSYVSGPYEFIPGTVAVHGHERAYSSVPGKYGLTRAVEYGANVVYGHTHTPLLVTTAVGTASASDRRNLWAMNVGHGMDMGKASYLQDGYATWCQAFGIVSYDHTLDRTQPELIMAEGGSFWFDAQWW